MPDSIIPPPVVCLPEHRKLGRKAIKTDTRTLRLSNYFTAALPPAPLRVDWLKGQTQFGMMLNDQLGDCTIAGLGHAEQVWTLNAGTESTLNDAVILQAYEQWNGYVAGDPSTDNGGIELDVLKNFQQHGLGGRKLIAFADPNIKHLGEVYQAINLFGGLYIGVSLPATAQNQDTWDVVPDPGDGSDEPGSWGGHCVFVPAYDSIEQTFTCITWGEPKKMTLAFWHKYVDEAHALLAQDWFTLTDVNPAGFNQAQLLSDLALVKA